jgi:hypothetical protein
LGYWRIFGQLKNGSSKKMVPYQRVHARVFNALWGVDRTRGLPHTKRLLNQRSFEGIVR